jgi:hypothetical protein
MDIWRRMNTGPQEYQITRLITQKPELRGKLLSLRDLDENISLNNL